MYVRARARARRGCSPQKAAAGTALSRRAWRGVPRGTAASAYAHPSHSYVRSQFRMPACDSARAESLRNPRRAARARGTKRHRASVRAGGVRARCCRRRSGEGRGHRVRPARPSRRVAPRWLRRGARQSVGRGWGVSGPGWAQPRRRGCAPVARARCRGRWRAGAHACWRVRYSPPVQP